MGSGLSSNSTSTSSPITSTTTTPTKEKCKACCACPETKRARDRCIVENGEADCTKLIEAHKQCMRDAGFVI